MKKVFNTDLPIIIGFAGRAGSGKTSVAEHLVPKGSIDTTLHGIKWDHIFFALPLYELASIKRSIKGVNEKNRKLYAIYDVLYEIYGGSPLGDFPDYSDMIDRVRKIYELPIEPEGVKPRTFLQTAGDLCRKDFDNCFAKWAVNKSKKIHSTYVKSFREEEEHLPIAIIISDVRFVNEAEEILKQENGVVVCFDALEETLNERIFKRDGKPMSEDQKSHRSEKEIDKIKEMATTIIRTDSMSIEEQANATLMSLGIIEEANA